MSDQRVIASSDDEILSFRYTNWQGKTAVRHVRPLDIWFGYSEYHKEKQWFLKAIDIEKDAIRDFAFADIKQFKPIGGA